MVYEFMLPEVVVLALVGGTSGRLRAVARLRKLIGSRRARNVSAANSALRTSPQDFLMTTRCKTPRRVSVKTLDRSSLRLCKAGSSQASRQNRFSQYQRRAFASCSASEWLLGRRELMQFACQATELSGIACTHLRWRCRAVR